MLVLSRQKGEEIYIGDDIKLTILKAGTRVRIGIEAPDSIQVLRGELRETQDNGDTAAGKHISDIRPSGERQNTNGTFRPLAHCDLYRSRSGKHS